VRASADLSQFGDASSATSYPGALRRERHAKLGDRTPARQERCSARMRYHLAPGTAVIGALTGYWTSTARLDSLDVNLFLTQMASAR